MLIDDGFVEITTKNYLFIPDLEAEVVLPNQSVIKGEFFKTAFFPLKKNSRGYEKHTGISKESIIGGFVKIKKND